MLLLTTVVRLKSLNGYISVDCKPNVNMQFSEYNEFKYCFQIEFTPTFGMFML